MAIIDEMNAVSSKYFDKGITQQIYDSSVFFKTLKEKKKIKTDGGTSLQFAIRKDKLGNARLTGARNQVNFASKETRGAADLDWAYYDSFTMCHWDEKVMNAGKAKLIDLMQDKATEMVEDFDDYLAFVLFGTDTSGFAPPRS